MNIERYVKERIRMLKSKSKLEQENKSKGKLAVRVSELKLIGKLCKLKDETVEEFIDNVLVRIGNENHKELRKRGREKHETKD